MKIHSTLKPQIPVKQIIVGTNALPAPLIAPDNISTRIYVKNSVGFRIENIELKLLS